MPLTLSCVGHASVDHHFEIAAFPSHATKTAAKTYHQLVGGMAANASIAASRLGARVRLLGRVGNDAAGDFVRAEVARLGLQAQLEVVAGAATSVSSVVVAAGGERQIYNHRGDAITRAHPLDLTQLTGCSAVLVDPRWVIGAAAALQWARAQGVLCMLDADVAPAADLRRLVPLADWAVFSEPGLAVYAHGESLQSGLQKALAAGARHAMVTRGPRGACWLHASAPDAAMQSQDAFPIEAVDTTGAGDVFHAALLLALAGGAPGYSAEPDAVRFACAAAALKCQRAQGVLGTPSLSEVLAFL